MTMSDKRPADGTKTNAPSPSDFVKGAAICGVTTWVFSLLALLSSSPRGLEGLLPFFFLFVSTLFLLLFVVPALLIGCVRARSSS
jgi:fatty acid desaturase